MISSHRPEPKFQAYANGNKAKWYQLEAQKLAKMDAIWANCQNHVAETLMGVTANQQQGSLNSAFGADRLMRGVQTFRYPVTRGHYGTEQPIRSRVVEWIERIHH